MENSRLKSLFVCAFALLLCGQVFGDGWNTVVFRDDFDGPGDTPEANDWVINHPESWWWVQGRTFFPSPVYHPEGPFPEVDNGVCVIEHHHYNPWHLGTPKTTFLGGEIHTVMEFVPDRAYCFEARVRCNPYPNGLVTSFFTYGYDGSKSDEIDFEFVSNKTNDDVNYANGAPVLTNPWNESQECPLYVEVNGLDLTEWNTFRIYWYPEEHCVEWTWLEPNNPERSLRKETNPGCVPDEPMAVYFNFWAPTQIWPDAYDASLQPVSDPNMNEIYRYEIDYIEVRVRGPVPHLKWSQPPIEIAPDPCAPTVYCGWDELVGWHSADIVWWPAWNCRTQCYGDADCSGCVNVGDVFAFESCLAPSYCPEMDFDRDGDVDYHDWGIWEYNMGRCPFPDCPLQPQCLKMVADDFRCLGTMPVTSIHWWGSYRYWEEPCLPPEAPNSWRIGFWSNVAADPFADPNFSRPDILLWQIEVSADRVQTEWAGYDMHPMFPQDTCFQHYVQLEPEEYFWQSDYEVDTQDNVFWLSIVALYGPRYQPGYPWGWKTRPWSWMDDAVWFDLAEAPGLGIELDPWSVNPIVDPLTDESFDVAFELDTDPSFIKWEQPFTGIRHWPHYEDEQSMAEAEPCDPRNILRLVADDWPCHANTPITAAVWWGSYIGYTYEACTGPVPRPLKPDYFLLTIWDDVPAGADPCHLFSHPNDVIWEYRAYDFDEVLVGYDKHPHGEPNEPVFRYSVKLPCEAWFYQEANDGVYWLSVVAVYDQNDPNYDWGWTNHEHKFNDDAVAGTFDAALGWSWQELFDQTGVSEDMSFMLFTDPDPNLGTCWDICQCPCQPQGDCTCDGLVNLADLFCLKAHFGKSAPWIDPECCADFDHSGAINLGDLFALKAGFGEPCPPGSTLNQKCP
ncbi:MAG: DUF7901 domain-containing protein [Planctomycetota bacterium]|jgi:hypothetical protein